MRGPDLAGMGLNDPWFNVQDAAGADAAAILQRQQMESAYMEYLRVVRWLKLEQGDRVAVREAEKNFEMAYKNAIIRASILKSPGV